jgi:hypothetical protein
MYKVPYTYLATREAVSLQICFLGCAGKPLFPSLERPKYILVTRKTRRSWLKSAKLSYLMRSFYPITPELGCRKLEQMNLSSRVFGRFVGTS